MEYVPIFLTQFDLMKKEQKRAKKLEDRVFGDIKEYLGKNQDSKEDYQRLSTIPGIGEGEGGYRPTDSL